MKEIKLKAGKRGSIAFGRRPSSCKLFYSTEFSCSNWKRHKAPFFSKVRSRWDLPSLRPNSLRHLLSLHRLKLWPHPLLFPPWHIFFLPLLRLKPLDKIFKASVSFEVSWGFSYETNHSSGSFSTEIEIRLLSRKGVDQRGYPVCSNSIAYKASPSPASFILTITLHSPRPLVNTHQEEMHACPTVCLLMDIYRTSCLSFGKDGANPAPAYAWFAFFDLLLIWWASHCLWNCLVWQCPCRCLLFSFPCPGFSWWDRCLWTWVWLPTLRMSVLSGKGAFSYRSRSFEQKKGPILLLIRRFKDCSLRLWRRLTNWLSPPEGEARPIQTTLIGHKEWKEILIPGIISFYTLAPYHPMLFWLWQVVCRVVLVLLILESTSATWRRGQLPSLFSRLPPPSLVQISSLKGRRYSPRLRRRLRHASPSKKVRKRRIEASWVRFGIQFLLMTEFAQVKEDISYLMQALAKCKCQRKCTNRWVDAWKGGFGASSLGSEVNPLGRWLPGRDWSSYACLVYAILQSQGPFHHLLKPPLPRLRLIRGGTSVRKAIYSFKNGIRFVLTSEVNFFNKTSRSFSYCMR